MYVHIFDMHVLRTQDIFYVYNLNDENISHQPHYLGYLQT